MTARSPFSQGFYALALLAFALVGMVTLALWPNMAANQLHDRLGDMQAQLSGFDFVMAEGEDLASWNNRLVQSSKKSGLLLAGATTGIAGAKLQEILLKYVAQNGGVVRLVQVLPPVQANELVSIPVSLNLITDTKGLRDIIFDLETNQPLLFVEDLAISRQLSLPSGRDGTVRRQGRLKLLVSMKVIGYVKPVDADFIYLAIPFEPQ